MLYLNASLSNPWYRKVKGINDYKNIFLTHGKLSENKHWEIEVHKDLRRILGLELSLSWRGRDHAGLEFGICLLGIDSALRIYDTRHWDYEKDQWISRTMSNSTTSGSPETHSEKNTERQSQVLVNQELAKKEEGGKKHEMG